MSSMSSYRFSGGRPAALLALAFTMGLPAAAAKAPKRCDWHGPLSGGEKPYAKCIDFATMDGKSFDLPKNVTRIAADGISFCQPKTPTTGAGDADIVFIYDNSGSMTADAAFIETNGDTSFYYISNDNGCRSNATSGSITVNTKTGPVVLPLLVSDNGCQGFAGDPQNARGFVVQEAINFLAATSATSTAGAISFNSITKYESSLIPVNNAAQVAALKASIQLDTSGGTDYKPPLALADQWLSNPAMIKTKKQAIVFISDGAPNNNTYVPLIPGLPPVYSIYLSKNPTPDTARLQEISAQTGGTFARVNPNDPNAMVAVLKQIISTITTNTLPKSATVTNKSMATPQVSRSTGLVVNPDGGAGMKLDSILGLKLGANQIEVQLLKEDNTNATYNFTLNVSADEISSTGGNFSCYDMPTLTAIDKATNTPPEIYSPDKTSYQLKLTRSPSELGDVTVSAVTPNNDKEGIKVGNTNMSLGYPTQTGDFNYNANKASPGVGNGILEVDNHGDMTFTWSHPRDAREAVTYILPGRVVPIISGSPDISIKKPVTEGVVFDGGKIKDPLVVTDSKDKCLVNCTGTEIFHKSDAVPTWNLTIKSPISYKVKIFDNLGQFVCASSGEINAAAWAALAKTGDSAAIHLKFVPVASTGQQLGTGAYLMRANVIAMGDQVTKNGAGESIVVRNASREYFKKFGYIRAF